MSTLLESPALAPPSRRGFPWRRLVRDISSVLIISGVLLMIDAGVTLIWQEPVTAVVALIKQSQIDERYLSRQPLTPVDQHALQNLVGINQRVAYLARAEARRIATGAAIGKGICNYSAGELREVKGLKSAAVRERLPRATEEAVHRDYFVLA